MCVCVSVRMSLYWFCVRLFVCVRGQSIHGDSDRLPGHRCGDLPQPGRPPRPADRQARLQVVQRYTHTHTHTHGRTHTHTPDTHTHIHTLRARTGAQLVPLCASVCMCCVDVFVLSCRAPHRCVSVVGLMYNPVLFGRTRGLGRIPPCGLQDGDSRLSARRVC